MSFRPRKSSAHVTLVLLGAATLAACGMPHFAAAITAGRAAPATLPAALAIVVGILNGACMTY
jgi:uncharacterized membrane protein YjfL (UPF0719 family)